MCTLIEYNITKTHQKLCGKKQMNFQVIFYLLCGYQMVAYIYIRVVFVLFYLCIQRHKENILENKKISTFEMYRISFINNKTVYNTIYNRGNLSKILNWILVVEFFLAKDWASLISSLIIFVSFLYVFCFFDTFQLNESMTNCF